MAAGCVVGKLPSGGYPLPPPPPPGSGGGGSSGLALWLIILIALLAVLLLLVLAARARPPPRGRDCRRYDGGISDGPPAGLAALAAAGG